MGYRALRLPGVVDYPAGDGVLVGAEVDSHFDNGALFESKTVTISYRNEDSRGALPVVEVTGFNKR